MKILKIKPVEVAWGNSKLQQNLPKSVGREGFTSVISKVSFMQFISETKLSSEKLVHVTCGISHE